MLGGCGESRNTLRSFRATFYALDEGMVQGEVFYVRCVDDILVFTMTSWKLRRAVRVLDQTFSELKVSQNPDKALVGRIERGFDFLAMPLDLARSDWHGKHQ